MRCGRHSSRCPSRREGQGKEISTGRGEKLWTFFLAAREMTRIFLSDSSSTFTSSPPLPLRPALTLPSGLLNRTRASLLAFQFDSHVALTRLRPAFYIYF